MNAFWALQDLPTQEIPELPNRCNGEAQPSLGFWVSGLGRSLSGRSRKTNRGLVRHVATEDPRVKVALIAVLMIGALAAGIVVWRRRR